MSKESERVGLKEYSLWMIPQGAIYRKFSTFIERLSRQYGSQLFEPHATLLGNMQGEEDDLIGKSNELATDHKPFTLNMLDVDYEDLYYRALFVRAEKTPFLQALHDQAKEIFEVKNVSVYMPHLSILYGNFSQEVKTRMIQDIGKEQVCEFVVDRLHLFQLYGEVRQWRKIQEFPFTVKS